MLEGDGLVVDPALERPCLVQGYTSIVGEMDCFSSLYRREKVARTRKVMHSAAIPNQRWIVRSKLVDQPKGYVAFESPGVDVVVGKIFDRKVAGKV